MCKRTKNIRFCNGLIISYSMGINKEQTVNNAEFLPETLAKEQIYGILKSRTL